ncbi:MAG: DUF2924 domain-containing protein [Sphingomonadaceae bacterium]
MARRDSKITALAMMSLSDLRSEWERLCGTSAPALAEGLLRMAMAYRLQEKAHAGLPAMISRELLRMAEGGAEAIPRTPAAPIRPGTRLVRNWNGRTIDVLAVEDGFLFEGKHFGSLTSIAREVTGARWSGPRFFGLTARG